MPLGKFVHWDTLLLRDDRVTNQIRSERYCRWRAATFPDRLWQIAEHSAQLNFRAVAGLDEILTGRRRLAVGGALDPCRYPTLLRSASNKPPMPSAQLGRRQDLCRSLALDNRSLSVRCHHTVALLDFNIIHRQMKVTRMSTRRLSVAKGG